jgi:hypothetical protein
VITLANAIFEDLEIDFSDMLSNPEGFAQRVYDKAEELRAICKADTSTAAFMERYKDQGETVPEEILQEFNSLYENIDAVDLSYMVDAIKQAKKLVSDLETAFRDRCMRQAAKEGIAIGNKRVAHAQYTRLKDDFNLYVKSIGMFAFGKTADLKTLPALPGNYGVGSSAFVNYIFEVDGEQYRNHHVICRKLGIEVKSLFDLLEYLETHETDVIVKEVQ